MADNPQPLGKIDPTFFERAIKTRLGAQDPAVLHGPASGVDCGTVRLASGNVLVSTTDPFFVVPTFGWQRAGWFAVHILASDFWTSGLRPQWMTVDLNLPTSMDDASFDALWQHVHDTCAALGIAIITGHTGRYDGCNYPMVGGATMLGEGKEAAVKHPRLCRPGDVVIATKGPAIEASALMAVSFPDQVRAALGDAALPPLDGLFEAMSTVRDAEIAVRTAGADVHAMHDATEGGVLGGLVEVAQSAGLGIEADLSDLPWPEHVAALCAHFDMHPLAAISEGTLLITATPNAAERIVGALAEAGIAAAPVATLTSQPAQQLRVDGKLEPLAHPRVDPFWAAFARAAGA